MSTVRSVAVFMAMLIDRTTGGAIRRGAAAVPAFRLHHRRRRGVERPWPRCDPVGHRQALLRAPHPIVGGVRRQLRRTAGRELDGEHAGRQRPGRFRRGARRGDRRPFLRVPCSEPGPDDQRGQVDDLRRNQIEPALRRGDWSGAAVAAANGLDRGRSQRTGAAAGRAGRDRGPGAGVLVVMRYRRRRRRAAELAAAKRVDATDPDALAALSLGALDDLSRWKVVDVDNAVRTSANELALTIEEFGEQRTEPFTRAVDSAKSALAQAFTVRQQLDDAIPETRPQRRELLTEVIVAAARADRELESQREAFEEMRDLVVNAPSRLDALTQQVVDLTARIDPAEQRMTELHNEFDSAALASVATNVATAKDRLAFADQNLGQARDLAAQPVSGEQSGLVDAVHAAESSLGQARSLLDAVDSAASDIRHAVATLPSLIADIQSWSSTPTPQLQSAQKTRAPPSARSGRRPGRGRDSARCRPHRRFRRPARLFTALNKADADLNRLLATVAEEQAAAERLNRTLEQALFTAQSRIHAVSDYIDTRRGSIGPEARTRLAEASRQSKRRKTRSTDLNEAITRANDAARLAAQAQSLADTTSDPPNCL